MELGTPKRKALLATLLASRNGSVSVDDLISELWGRNPPDSATPNLRNYIAQIRRSLPPEERHRLYSHNLRYVFEVADDELDYAIFEQSAREGRLALNRGDLTEAARQLGQARRLWRGRPLENVPQGPFLAQFTAWIEERHIGVMEDLFELQLSTGMLGELVVQLRAWVARHPFRERPWRILMIALHELGDPSAALAAYREVCDHLHSELDIEPGAELRALHDAIRHRVVDSKRVLRRSA